MTLHRIQAKYFVTDPSAVDLESFIPIFHRWIQEHRIDELLIDVVDYIHVQDGPGIVLIGHEADYAFDMTRGRPGLLYRRKRDLVGDLQEVLRTVFRQALLDCQLLEADPSLEGKIQFRTNEVEITFLDRLHVPNEPDSLGLVRHELEAVLTEVYGDVDVHIDWLAFDRRHPFTVRVRVPEAPGLDTLVRRVNYYTPVLG